MKIEIPDAFARLCHVDEQEALELLVIAIYKAKGIHGALAGDILSMSEFAFHSLLAKRGVTVNYGIQDLADDIREA